MVHPGMKYRSPRRPTDIEIEVEHDNEIVLCRLHDVSLHGARLDGDFNLAGPDRMTIFHNGRKIGAKIVWMRFGTIGVAFDRQLERNEYNALIGIASRRAAPGNQKTRFLMT